MSASEPTDITIFGECRPKFAAVKDAFYRNFQDFGDIGTAGAGGYFAFADPDRHLSFGYTSVRQITGDGMGVEPKRIIDAIYSCISTA